MYNKNILNKDIHVTDGDKKGTAVGDKKGSSLSRDLRVNTNSTYSQDLGISFGLWYQENAIKPTAVSF